MKRTITLIAGLFVLLPVLVPTASADVKLPNVLASQMVLQRDVPLNIWGTADAGEAVSVAIGKQLVKTTANDQGSWQVQLKAQTLDLSQKAFGARTFHDWIEQLFSMALDGLTEWDAQSQTDHERMFLEPFAESFLSNGPKSLQIQKEFEKSDKLLKIYLRDRWLQQKQALGAALKAA